MAIALVCVMISESLIMFTFGPGHPHYMVQLADPAVPAVIATGLHINLSSELAGGPGAAGMVLPGAIDGQLNIVS